jgi:hypothetical protein
MILAQFCRSQTHKHPYTDDVRKRQVVITVTVSIMSFASHVIEKEQFSSRTAAEGKRIMRLRRLILLGLAGAMALATLAPVVVLAG